MNGKQVLMLAICMATVPCPARTITVDDNAPADFPAIHAAVDDANDLQILCDSWLTETLPSPADLDRNGTVDFRDFADFLLYWRPGQ